MWYYIEINNITSVFCPCILQICSVYNTRMQSSYGDERYVCRVWCWSEIVSCNTYVCNFVIVSLQKHLCTWKCCVQVRLLDCYDMSSEIVLWTWSLTRPFLKDKGQSRKCSYSFANHQHNINKSVMHKTMIVVYTLCLRIFQPYLTVVWVGGGLFLYDFVSAQYLFSFRKAFEIIWHRGSRSF